MDLSKLTAKQLSNMLKLKQCSALEIIKSVFEQIETKENDIKAYITLTKDQAFNQAKMVDEKIAKGEKLSDLAGIPIAIKDIICTKGILTTAASKMLYNFIPPYDATVIKHLLSNDMVITGKTNLDEFAMGSSCETSYFKKTANPHNLKCVSGGSSGGSAAAIAANETILALGSDTGGSIRLPASFCGVVGLRPTYGRVSRYGLIALASSLDQIGPITKTVEDSAMLFSAICGVDEKDSTTLDARFVNFAKDLEVNMSELKIAVPKEYFNEHIDEEVNKLVMNAIRCLEDKGAVVKEISLPSAKYSLPIYYVVLTIEAASNLARLDGVRYGYRTNKYNSLEEMYEKTRSEGFGDEVKRRIMLGTFISSEQLCNSYLKRAAVQTQKIKDEYENAFEDFDILITPTAASTAFKFGEITNPLKMHATDICALSSSIAGLPVLSVPCGFDSKNMPVGMQIIGTKFSEHLLFKVGHFYEKNCK